MNNLILKISVYLWRTTLIFPWKIQIIFGKLLGNILLIIPFKRNKFSKANIELCFPELSKSKKIKFSKEILFYLAVYYLTQGFLGFGVMKESIKILNMRSVV